MNVYTQMDEYTQVTLDSPTYGTFYVKVDDDDVDMLKKYTWIVNKCWNKKTNKVPRFYAGCNLHGGGNALMHRLIMNAPKGKIVDHVNGDERDNRRANLRICTQKENIENSKHYVNSTSGCKGVCWDKKTQKWIAYIKITDCYHRLGFFDDKGEAIRRRKQAELKYFDEYAYDLSLAQNYQSLFLGGYKLKKPTCDCLKRHAEKIPKFEIATIIQEDISVPVKYDPNNNGVGFVRYLEYDLNFCPECGKPMQDV